MALYNKIVIVDDDKIYSGLMHKKMIKMKIANEVTNFDNGKKALDFVNENHEFNIDLMIVDINMPTMNGYELLKILDKIKSVTHVKAILVASNTITTKDRAKFLQLNCVSNVIEKTMVIDYIKKIKDEF